VSYYDELTKLFDPWRHNWVELYRQHQFLPSRLARAFQQFLGCPVAFSNDPIDKTAPETKYVSPTRAVWDDATENFALTAHDNEFLDVDFRDDGYFYFGLRVFLEHGPTTYPKMAFWFLFRGKFVSDHFEVWVQRSGRKFEVGVLSPGETNALFQHLFDVLKGQLAESPIGRIVQEPSRIGFNATLVEK
jgi:hypothetical protein